MDHNRNPIWRMLARRGAFTLIGIVAMLLGLGGICLAQCDPPVIVTQPLSQQIGSGLTAELTVSATGTALLYQWYWGDSPDDLSPIGGATDSSYITQALTATTSFWVRVYHLCDGAIANSDTATVTVVIPEAQRNALIALYLATTGDSWDDYSNWRNPENLSEFNLPGTEGTWKGITVGSGTTVTEIKLPGNNLTYNELEESLPAALGDLTDLTLLDLSFNGMIGGIPAELGELSHLVTLRLTMNGLSGGIPSEFGNLTNLHWLELDYNQLSGSIPTTLGGLTNVNLLRLTYNALTGGIPMELGDLATLTSLELGGNQLTDGIPAELGNLSNLTLLDLSQNLLLGEIPMEIGQLDDLQYLVLRGNQLSGNIPAALGDLTELRQLYLNSNRLSGNIPAAIGNLVSLEMLTLQGNQLTGNPPAEMVSLTGLWSDSLDLRWNALYTDNETLRTFLNSKQDGGNWESTQTISPKNVTAAPVTDSSVAVSWTPITYTGDTGRYEVLYNTSSSRDYSSGGTTANKTAGSLTVSGLDPANTYYFLVRALTDPHDFNPNTVTSERYACSDLVMSTGPTSVPGYIYGNPVTLTVEASGTTPYAYQWYSCNETGGDCSWHKIEAADGGTASSISPVLSNTFSFQAQVSNSCQAFLSAKATIGPKPTVAVVSNFTARPAPRGMLLGWETAAETGTAGFNVLRRDDVAGTYVRVNRELLPALLTAPQGGVYRYLDESAPPGRVCAYKLEEVEARGIRSLYGPFPAAAGKDAGQLKTVTVKADDADAADTLDTSGYDRRPHSLSGTPPGPAGTVPVGSGSAGRADVAPPVTAAADDLAGDEPDGTATATARILASALHSVKIPVTATGLYFLDNAAIAGPLGAAAKDVRELLRGNQLRLANQGHPVAWTPAPRYTGLYFYGEAPADRYSRENVYWLDAGPGLRMAALPGAGLTPANADAVFADTAARDEDRWPVTSLFTDPDADFWIWDYLVAGNAASGHKTFTLAAPGATGAGTAALTLDLLGGTDSGHHATVALNGQPVGGGQWRGPVAHTLEIPVDPAWLRDGDNSLELTAVLDSGQPYSIVYLDRLALDYQRRCTAVADRLLVRGDGQAVVTVDGFSGPGITVLNVADPARPVLLTAPAAENPAAGGYRVSFRPETPATPYLVSGPGGRPTLPALAADTPSSLKTRRNAADYLVIVPAALQEAARRLAAYREGQGLKTMVVLLEDVFDEFNWGNRHPRTIRDFLTYARNNWKTAPRFVVLAGEGTFDYRNNQGYGDNLIPPLMTGTPDGLFASDNQLAGADDSHRPAMAIGRLPVTTAAELDTVAAKIAAFEGAAGAPWRKSVLMLADDADEGGDFPAASEAVAALLPGALTVDRVYLSDLGLEASRQEIQAALADGAGWLNYIGHAGVDRLAQEGLMTSGDVTGLANGPRVPIVAALTCVVGNYAIPGYDSLAERLLLDPDGGAAAVWAPTGMSFNDQAVALNQELVRAVFASPEPTLGEALLQAMRTFGGDAAGLQMLDLYTLLGDPALRLY